MNYETIERAIRDGEAEHVIPARCVRTLTEIVEGRSPLLAVRHPLGFLCLPIERRGQFGVCVHVWTESMSRSLTTTSAMHSHSWDLLSFVLYGEIGNVSVQVTDDPVGGTHRIFEVCSLDDVDEMRATPRLVRYLEKDRRMARAGDIYRLRAGEFHESVLGASLEAATVVLGRGRSAPDLSLGPRDAATHRVARERCGGRETVDVARIVIQRLAKTVSA